MSTPMNVPDVLTGAAAGAVIQFVIERSVPRIEKNLLELRRMLSKPIARGSQRTDVSELPSASIIGVGRCGSNIALYVARLLSISKKDDPVEEKSAGWWVELRERLVRPDGKAGELPSSPVNPVILIGDLDGNSMQKIEDFWLKRIKYDRLRLLTQLRDLQTGGSGNVPILGQYMGRVALNARIDDVTALDDRDAKEERESRDRKRNWVLNRTYFIDSAGSNLNNSRLFFYVFSTGGGSGSGMTPELSLAQQYAFALKLEQEDKQDEEDSENPLRFTQICSLGIGVLPTLDDDNRLNAVYINSGRLLCRYLAHQMRFDKGRPEKEKRKASQILDPRNLRLFNGLMLVSNHVMKWIPSDSAIQKRREEQRREDNVQEMESAVNQYIAQQVVNLLTAQADEAEDRKQDDEGDNDNNRSSVKIGTESFEGLDTVGLDPNDLSNSLNGPIVVGYAETSIEQTKNASLNARDLVIRAVSLPRKNQMQALEGISLLPIPKEPYEEVLMQVQESGDFSKLAELPLFKGSNSVVTIISVPETYSLVESDLREVRSYIESLFPNAHIRRYALVKGATKRIISFTILSSGGASTCSEVLLHLFSYIGSCFKQNDLSDDEFDELLTEVITSPKYDAERIEPLLADTEDPASVLAGASTKGQWAVMKKTYERNYQQLLGKDRFRPIDDVLLTKGDVLDALEYINICINRRQPRRPKLVDPRKRPEKGNMKRTR